MKIRDLFDTYYETYAKVRCKRPAWIKANFERYFKTIAERGAEALQPIEVSAWHGKIGSENGFIIANRALTLLRRLYNYSIKFHLIPSYNPTLATERFLENSRDRVLLDKERPKLLRAINQHATEYNRDLFYLVLLTAQRIGNVCKMKWEDIDLENAIWTIKAVDAKNKTSHTIPLVEEAVAILKRRHAHKLYQYVFPGRLDPERTHIVSPYKAWHEICLKAGISNLRPHDLRRTHATALDEAGEDIAVIQKALGHKDIKSTMIYVKPQTNTVRRAMRKAVINLLNDEEPAS